MCGCVGLKPSLGRIPLAILPHGLRAVLPLRPARADHRRRRALSLGHRRPRRARHPLPAPPPGEATPAAPVPGDVAGLKIALSPDLGFFSVDDDVAANLAASANALREAGAEVEEIALPWDRSLVDVFVTHWAVLMALCFGEHLDAWREQMDPAVVSLIEKGNRPGALELRRTELVRTRQWESLRSLFERFDALLCPTVRLPAPSVELSDSDFNKTDEAGRFLGMVMTMPFNLLGQCPALSVPSGFSPRVLTHGGPDRRAALRRGNGAADRRGARTRPALGGRAAANLTGKGWRPRRPSLPKLYLFSSRA